MQTKMKSIDDLLGSSDKIIIKDNSNKNLGGRPKLSEENVKKDKVITYVTSNEKIDLVEHCRSIGMNQSDLVRFLIKKELKKSKVG
jgi:hypothetical protein